MSIGGHSILYSKRPEGDRAFLRDVLGLPSVDAGDGWLIFGLPPAEVAVHPSDENDLHEFYLMSDDIEALIAAMHERGIPCSPALNRGWGLLAQVTLPGGGKLGIYQPRHARPKAMSPGKKARGKAPRATRTARKASQPRAKRRR